jgi:protein AATF/BFR2
LVRKHPHTLQILQKWSNKIQSVSPAALLPSKRTTFRQQAIPKSTIDLIQEAVDDGRAKAVGRTRVRRAAGGGRIGDVALATSLVGEGLFKGGTGEERDKAPEEGDAEIFDDTDFYQEMLRDVIDSKTAKDGKLHFFESFCLGSC